MKTRLILVLTLFTLVSLAVFFTLPAAEARPMGRTSVEGVWGLAPVSYTGNGTQTLTPTNSLYLVAPTATLTLTLATGDAQPGDWLFLVSQVATETRVVDTGSTIGGAGLTVTGTATATGVIHFIYNGRAWAQIGAVTVND